MANDEHKQQQVFQDVDPTNLGQLSPGYTPYLELQNQNRGRGRGLSSGGTDHQLGKATGQPQQTEMGSEKLLEAGQAAAKNLKQYPDITASRDEAAQTEKNFVASHVNTLQDKANQKTTSKLHESDKNLVQDKKQEKDQDKEHEHER